MKSKRWTLGVIGVYFVLLCIIAVVMVVIDPYFHFHAPLEGLSYTMDDPEYINDGITKNFDYDMVITGDSGTRGFSKVVADELFNAKSIRVTFLGEGFKRINENLQVAIDTNPNVKLVIRDIGTLFFVTDENWLGYDEYPEYIYDDNLWNDVYYVFNGEILCKRAVPEIVRTARKESFKSFDDYIDAGEKGSRESVLSSHERNPKENREIDEKETEEMFDMLDRNLQKNVIEIIEEHPDVTFYLFFPPYSILWWDNLNQFGEDVLHRRIQMEKFAIEKLLPYDNVRLFSFNAESQLICNLDNYVDDVHYTSDTCTQIMEWMKEGKYELTEENYEKYIDELTEFLFKYDFDTIFEE